MAWVESYIVNGTSFDSTGFAIETVTQSTPVLRGENVVPAMDHGVRWREKRLGARSEEWEMWVCDVDPVTGLPKAGGDEARRAQFHDNWDEVAGILYTTHAAAAAGGNDAYEAPLQVVRRLKSTPGSPADAYTVNYGELNGPLEVDDYTTFQYARFTVGIGYVDPRWYACDSSGNKTDSALTADGNPGGTALMTRMTIALASATNPYIINNTTGSKLTYTGTGAVTFDTTNYTATSGVTNVTGSVDRTGSTTTDWFQLRSGVSNDFSSNTTYTITYTKAYI